MRRADPARPCFAPTGLLCGLLPCRGSPPLTPPASRRGASVPFPIARRLPCCPSPRAPQVGGHSTPHFRPLWAHTSCSTCDEGWTGHASCILHDESPLYLCTRSDWHKSSLLVSPGGFDTNLATQIQLRRAPSSCGIVWTPRPTMIHPEDLWVLLLLWVSCSVVSNRSATPWTVAHQAPLSTGFPRQEDPSGLPFPPPGDLPHPTFMCC